jgi:hypothetical protein
MQFLAVFVLMVMNHAQSRFGASGAPPDETIQMCDEGPAIP